MRVETIVVGAGPAGCAAAIALARVGHPVLLLEREAAPRESVCGEFLGPDAAAALAQCGLDLPALGALPLRGLRLGWQGWQARSPLPFAAWALPRLVLDAALQERAAAAGALLLRGATVRRAVPAGEGWQVATAGACWTARHLVLATGKHTLRGHPRPGAAAGALGLKLPLRGLAPAEEVALLRFPGGYAGLQPRPGGGANLCAALWGAPGEAARDAAALLRRVAAGSALAGALLAGARPVLARPLAVAGLPYGFRHRPQTKAPPALFRVGDQLAVIPSFTGDGVAMALHGGLAAAAAILAGQPANAFHAAWSRRSAGAMRWAGLAAGLLRHAPALFLAGATLPALPRLVARRTRLPAAPEGSGHVIRQGEAAPAGLLASER